MKTIKLIGACFALVSMALAMPANAAEAANEPADGEETEAPKPKKRPPRKENLYRNWDKVTAAAEAWEQPILTFVELSGEPRSGMAKLKVLGKQEFFKEIVMPNCLYFQMTVPKVKEVRNNTNGNNRRPKQPPRPDWSAMRDSDATLAKRLCGMNRPGGSQSLPTLALWEPNGQQLIGIVPLSTEGAVIGEFVSGLKSAFELKKYEFKVSPRLQKIIDKEAKAVADLEKKHK